MKKRVWKAPQDTDIREEESQGELEQHREEEQGGVSDIELLRLARTEETPRGRQGKKAA